MKTCIRCEKKGLVGFKNADNPYIEDAWLCKECFEKEGTTKERVMDEVSKKAKKRLEAEEQKEVNPKLVTITPELDNDDGSVDSGD